ncbi:MAG: hypothetical protein V3V97_12500, partial [Hyphomicrobiaceae bacterium]
MRTENSTTPARRVRTFAKIILLVLFIAAANVLTGWFVEQLQLEIRPSNEHLVHRMIMISAVLYAVLLALPFVPGVEIGLALIMILGPKIVPLVYVCTVAGLSLSFFVGRFIPEGVLRTLLDDLGLLKASRLVGQLEGMDRRKRLDVLVSHAPKKIIPSLIRHRYLALAIILNIPGNALIGGGGGIALIAGMSRLFSVPGFLLTLMVAVAPVPLAVLIAGKHV